MVSTYVVVKLFRKATYERSRKNVDHDEESPCNASQRETSKCRICLKDGSISIYNHQGSDISADISTFGDIEISEDDEYPKFICGPCHKLLEAAIQFRKYAKTSNQILKDTANKKSNLSDIKLNDVDIAQGIIHNDETKPSKHFLSADSDNEISGKVYKPVTNKKKITKIQCRICYKIITKAYYKEHFALHEHSAVKYVCDICGKSFRQRGSYRNHYSTHSSEFPFKCNLCPYKGRHSGLLKTHMRSHTGDYRYMCAECPAKFLTNSNLTKHSLKHKDPMFKCETCHRGFHSKLILQRHFEADHLGIKNHICNVCGKAFGYRKVMMRHQLDVHKREKKLIGRTPAYIEAEIKI